MHLNSSHNIIDQHLDFLGMIIRVQGKLYSGKDAEVDSIYQIPMPVTKGDDSQFSAILYKIIANPSAEEEFAIRAIITLALAPHIKPQFLDMLAVPGPGGGEFTEYGRFKWQSSNAFIPSVQTALFLLADNDLKRRFQLMEIFHSKHPLFQENVLELTYPNGSTNFLEQRLSVTKEFLHKVLLNQIYVPDQGHGFPAKEITTLQDWEDLVLPDHVRRQIDELLIWVTHHKALMEDPHLGKKLKPGYRVLLHGPPGTGKTLTASLFGKTLNKPVFRIDLSMLVSKYIGETEKNLSRLFDIAENKDWILFFDEADALFGKRSQTKDSHDRYANQEVSYLLSRIEDYAGLVILASNFTGNIDPAFMRRFQAIVEIPFPKPKERLELWKKALPPSFTLDKGIDLGNIAKRYELSGSQVINIVQLACIKSLSNGQKKINQELLHLGIQREYQKSKKLMPR